MENGDNLKWLNSRTVDDEVRADWPEENSSFREVLPCMSHSGSLAQLKEGLPKFSNDAPCAGNAVVSNVTLNFPEVVPSFF